MAADPRTDLDDLTDRCRDVAALQNPQSPPVPEFAVRAADLRQLDDEFGELTIDWRAKTLGAVTGPVTLRGVELGPFAITLPREKVARAPGVGRVRVSARPPARQAGHAPPARPGRPPVPR